MAKGQAGGRGKLAEGPGNDRFQIECSEFLQHHSPDSCIGGVEMIAPVTHTNWVATRSGVAIWRFGDLAIGRLADLALSDNVPIRRHRGGIGWGEIK